MKEYKVGEYYMFWVTGIGNQRIYLKDENDDAFSVYAFDYQTEWDLASPKVSLGELKCYVKQVSSLGFPKLEQSRVVTLITCYPEIYNGGSTRNHFIVDSLKTIGDTLYYVVVDAFGIQHMYKPSSKQKQLQFGDEVELLVSGIKEKENNRSHLILQEIADENTLQPTATQIVEEDDSTPPIGPFGEETDRVEFKSTIVYPSKAVEADIDTQMSVILRTIAGFLNAKGGTLFIGVNDNGDAIGIEQEYDLLNSSNKDNFTYKPNKDGYENKLRSGMNWHLGPVAQDYVSISFLEYNGHTVCKIEVESSRTVIWYDEYIAYKRMGNRTSHLRSEAIIKLVFDKASLTRPEAMMIKPISVQTEDEMLVSNLHIDSEQEEKPIIAKSVKETLKNIGEEKRGNGSFYMNLYANGDWSWSRAIPTDTDLEYCIPINNPASKNDLILVYDDGHVNRLDAYHFRLKKDENIRMNNGRWTGAKLIKAFHAKAEDLLACLSTANGHEFVKVHTVEQLKRSNKLDHAGCFAIKKDANKAEIYFVASEHKQRVSSLIKTKNQLNSFGIQTDLPKNSRFLQEKETLLTLRDIPSVK